MEKVRVLISILNWNNWESTVKAVNSLSRLEYKNFDIIISDNNSQDDSYVKLKKHFPNTLVWRFTKNLGYAGAHKKAANYAIIENYDLLWILNNDIEVFTSTLTELVNSYQKNGECLYGSVCLKEDGKTIHFGGGFDVLDVYDYKIKYNPYQGKDYSLTKMKERPVSDLGGASLLIPVSIIKKYGFIDTHFFLYAEETDYSYRLRRKNNIQSIIVPNSKIIHRSSESFKLAPDLSFVKAYYTTRNSNILYRKYFKDFKIPPTGGLLHLIKFFAKHYIMNDTKKDYSYWMVYYTKLGYLHAQLRLKGKYLEPNNFIKSKKNYYLRNAVR